MKMDFTEEFPTYTYITVSTGERGPFEFSRCYVQTKLKLT